MGYRDDLEAALERIASLEAEAAKAGRGEGATDVVVRDLEGQLHRERMDHLEAQARASDLEARCLEEQIRAQEAVAKVAREVVAVEAEAEALRATVRAQEVRIAALETELDRLRQASPERVAEVDAAELDRLERTLAALDQLEEGLHGHRVEAEAALAELGALPEGDRRRREIARKAAELQAFRDRLRLVGDQRETTRAELEGRRRKRREG